MKLVDSYTEPMYDDEFLRLINSADGRATLLTHINILRGSNMGLKFGNKELEEKFDLARQYQRALDVQWFKYKGFTGTANALEKSPLDHE